MEDIRTYREDDDENWHIPDDEREYSTAPDEAGVPMHIPRD
jgi:hypothetical protein